MTKKEAERALEIAKLNADYWAKRVIQAMNDLARFENGEKK